MEFTTHFELQSQTTRLHENLLNKYNLNQIQGFHLLWLDFPIKLCLNYIIVSSFTLQLIIKMIEAWAIPTSFAITKGIIVIFFSSA